MNKEKQAISAVRGLTLIEVLISMAILATVIMTVFSIYTQCIVEIRRAKNRTLATNFARMMVEMIVSSPHAPSHYDGLSTAVTPPGDNPASHDLLTWKTALDAFPTAAAGTISASLEQYSHLVSVEIRYEDYGKTTANTLSIRIASRSRHF